MKPEESETSKINTLKVPSSIKKKISMSLVCMNSEISCSDYTELHCENKLIMEISSNGILLA